MPRRASIVSVTSLQIENWGCSYPAKSEFPRVIRRLICASGLDLRITKMGGGEYIFLSGADGITDARDGNEYVPEGIAIWELTTQADDLVTKARSCFETRSADQSIADKHDKTFVFATTARSFPNLVIWRTEAANRRI